MLHTGIIALILLLSVQGVYYILFDLAQVSFKSESQRSISENKNLGVITLSLKIFSQRADKNEIWVDGALYDISKYHIDGDRVYVTVYHDKDEEGWVKNITSIFEVSDNNLQGQHISKVHSNGFNDCKILPNPYRESGMASLYPIKDIPHRFCFYYLDGYTSITSPPPESVTTC